MKCFFLLLLASVLLSCSGKPPVETGFNWPRWGGPDGNWISKETGWNPKALEGGPRILWKVDLGYGYSNVAIKGDRLYTMGEDLVYCLNAWTGKTLWEYASGSRGFQSTPTVDGDLVFALSTEGALFCLNAQNGELHWKKDLVAEYGAVSPYYRFAAPPVVEGDLLLLTINSSGMALKRETGQLVWTSDAPPPHDQMNVYQLSSTTGTDYPAPVIYNHGGKHYALFSSWKGISAVDVQSGESYWLYAWELYIGNNAPDPVVNGGRVLVTGFVKSPTSLEDRQSVLLDVGEKPQVRWKSKDLWSDISTPVVISGYIYGCFGGPDYGSADLRCLDLETGKLMWKKKVPDGGFPKCISLMAADGKLIVLTDTGMLYIAEASRIGFKEISSCDVLRGEKKYGKFWEPPVLCNGRIYCRNYGGDLVCIDVRK